MMIVELSDEASNAVLDTLSDLMDGGSIELLADDDRTLAVLQLADPATADAEGRELVFNQIGEEDAALTQGYAANARILGGDGNVVFSCDVGDDGSDAVIKLNTVRIFRGAPVRINSFRLRF